MTEAFICDAIRTPIGRYGGVLSGVRTDDLAALPIAALMQRNAGADWQAVDDVVFGCANQAGEDNRNVARMAALLAGLPVDVPGVTVNRLCGSGLDAVAIAARQIRSRRGRARDRGRRREHEPRALRAVEAGRGLHAQPADVRHDDRLALRESADEAAVRHRLDAGDRRERRRGVRASRAPTRTRSRCAASSARSRAQASGRLAAEIVAGDAAREEGRAGRSSSATSIRARRASRRSRSSARRFAPAARSPPAMPRASTTAPARSSSRASARRSATASRRARASSAPRSPGVAAAHHGHGPGAGVARS